MKEQHNIMTKEECEELREELNSIHEKLSQKPDELKYGYWEKPESILNAYREGDVSMEGAVKTLERIYAAHKAKMKEEVGKWELPEEKQPERIKEHWCPEVTAQEVIIQYLRAKRYEMCVGWFEGGKWWCNDEEIKYKVVAWTYLPKQYQPKIHWEFDEWAEKATGEAFIIGIDDNGIKYEATGIMGGGEIVEVREVNAC